MKLEVRKMKIRIFRVLVVRQWWMMMSLKWVGDSLEREGVFGK